MDLNKTTYSKHPTKKHVWLSGSVTYSPLPEKGKFKKTEVTMELDWSQLPDDVRAQYLKTGALPIERKNY